MPPSIVGNWGSIVVYCRLQLALCGGGLIGAAWCLHVCVRNGGRAPLIAARAAWSVYKSQHQLPTKKGTSSLVVSVIQQK